MIRKGRLSTNRKLRRSLRHAGGSIKCSGKGLCRVGHDKLREDRKDAESSRENWKGRHRREAANRVPGGARSGAVYMAPGKARRPANASRAAAALRGPKRPGVTDDASQGPVANAGSGLARP